MALQDQIKLDLSMDIILGGEAKAGLPHTPKYHAHLHIN